MSINLSDIEMLILTLKEAGKNKSAQIVSDMKAEIERLRAPADMVRMMEVLWAEGYQLEFTPSASLKNHICIIQKEHYYSSTSRENDYLGVLGLAINELLATLDRQPGEELKKKLGMQYCPKDAGEISHCEDDCYILLRDNRCDNYREPLADYEPPLPRDE